MKSIVIKCGENTAQIRDRAFVKALEYEVHYMPNREVGTKNGVVWTERGYYIHVYHTRTTIVAVIDTPIQVSEPEPKENK